VYYVLCTDSCTMLDAGIYTNATRLVSTISYWLARALVAS
jgi:hypothetical protein